MKILSILLISFLIVSNTFTARVVGITDGDSITILTDENEQVKIRLEGIDCPEPRQDFGNRAKQTTSELCFGKSVRIVKTGTDRYGRTLAHVYVGEVSVGHELLRRGLAWHYKSFSRDTELARLEEQARQSGIGLWSHANPVPPWEWRKTSRNNSGKR